MGRSCWRQCEVSALLQANHFTGVLPCVCTACALEHYLHAERKKQLHYAPVSVYVPSLPSHNYTSIAQHSPFTSVCINVKNSSWCFVSCTHCLISHYIVIVINHMHIIVFVWPQAHEYCTHSLIYCVHIIFYGISIGWDHTQKWAGLTLRDGLILRSGFIHTQEWVHSYSEVGS